MAQYLSALLGMRGGGEAFGTPNNGRWGDYAFTQDGEIITYLSKIHVRCLTCSHLQH